MKMLKFEVDGNALFNKIIWLIITAAISFSAMKFNDMARDISQLNLKMVEVVNSLATSKEALQDHEQRLRNLEGK